MRDFDRSARITELEAEAGRLGGDAGFVANRWEKSMILAHLLADTIGIVVIVAVLLRIVRWSGVFR